MDCAELPHDNDALDYAYRIIRELKQDKGYGALGIAMVVKDAALRVVFSIPLCAGGFNRSGQHLLILRDEEVCHGGIL